MNSFKTTWEIEKKNVNWWGMLTKNLCMLNRRFPCAFCVGGDKLQTEKKRNIWKTIIAIFILDISICVIFSYWSGFFSYLFDFFVIFCKVYSGFFFINVCCTAFEITNTEEKKNSENSWFRNTDSPSYNVIPTRSKVSKKDKR